MKHEKVTVSFVSLFAFSVYFFLFYFTLARARWKTWKRFKVQRYSNSYFSMTVARKWICFQGNCMFSATEFCAASYPALSSCSMCRRQIWVFCCVLSFTRWRTGIKVHHISSHRARTQLQRRWEWKERNATPHNHIPCVRIFPFHVFSWLKATARQRWQFNLDSLYITMELN